jgi:hypothetical protein
VVNAWSWVIWRFIDVCRDIFVKRRCIGERLGAPGEEVLYPHILSVITEPVTVERRKNNIDGCAVLMGCERGVAIVGGSVNE